jgi:hypothetical protein
MANGANGKWVGIGVGDVDSPDTPRNAPNWNAITLLTDKLNRNFKWARDMGIVKQPNYTTLVATAVEKYCTNPTISLPVVRDAAGFAVANLTMRTRLGSYPPPPPPRHAMLTVRGTGGLVDADPTSWIADASSNHYEVPIMYAATMGGIPVAVAGAGPSGNECADQVHQMLTDWVLTHTGTFSLSAYSLATKGVHMFLNDITNPGHPLFKHLPRLVCVILIGDPWRPFGHSFYLGPIPAGQGIGTPYFTLSERAIKTLGWRICWLTNPADLYANSPLGGTGQVLADVEEIILGFSMADPMGTMMLALQQLMKILTQDAGLMEMLPGGGLLGGGGLPGILTGVAGGSTAMTMGLAGLMLPLIIGGFQGLIAGVSGNGQNLPKGPAADAQAAILALKFFGSGIRGHVSYHVDQWGIGPQTYIDLGIQHSNDWGALTPVAA